MNQICSDSFYFGDASISEPPVSKAEVWFQLNSFQGASTCLWSKFDH